VFHGKFLGLLLPKFFLKNAYQSNKSIPVGTFGAGSSGRQPKRIAEWWEKIGNYARKKIYSYNSEGRD
jgi:hypothetical protein